MTKFLSDSTFGLKIYEIECCFDVNKPESTTHKQFVVATPIGICEVVRQLIGEQGAQKVRSGPIHIPGLKLSVEGVSNALQYVGWNGDYLPFDVYQRNYDKIKTIQASEGMLFDKLSEQFVEAKQIGSYFSPEFLCNVDSSIVVFCSSCTFWADISNETLADSYYHIKCPTCGETLYAEDAKWFKEAHDIFEKWEAVQEWKSVLEVNVPRSEPISITVEDFTKDEQ